VHDAGSMSSPRHLNDPETYAIIGAALAVHAELGCGFLETVYKAALAVEFRRRAIAFDRDVPLPVVYKGEPLPLAYRVDFLCAKSVIVDVHAHEALNAGDVSQAVNYVRAARIDRGLLLNFGTRSLEHRRLVWRRPETGPASSGPCAAASRTLTWTAWRDSRRAGREAPCRRGYCSFNVQPAPIFSAGTLPPPTLNSAKNPPSWAKPKM
jgi:GxxExxY protein